MCFSYWTDVILKIYVLDDLNSFEYVENYANNIIVNWFMNVKCDMNYDLNAWLHFVVWDLNYANIDWWIDVLNCLLFYIESMCLRHEHESNNILIEHEHGTWNKNNMDIQ